MNNNNTSKYRMDMCSGAVLPKMLSFCMPIMASSVLQLLFNAADIIVVGRFAGDNSLAAVGSTSSLVNLMVNLFIGLSVGANVAVARFYGAKLERDLSKAVHTAMTISLISGVFLTVVGVIGAPFFLRLMSSPENVLPLASKYLRIYFCGMTASMLYNFGAAVLRAVGDTKRPLYYLFAAGVINFILNLIFVIAFRMDVAGVAVATIISQMISAALVVRCLIKEKGGVHLDLKKLGIDKQKLLLIMQVGIPAGLQGCMFSLSNVVIQSSINLFGDIVVAGNAAAMNLEGFMYVAMNCFHQGTISFVGQNFGAGKYDRIGKIVAVSTGCVLVTAAGLAVFMLAFGKAALGIYSTNPDVINAGIIRVMIIAPTYFLLGIMDIYVGALRGLGYSMYPMVSSLIGVCGLRLLLIALIFSQPQYHVLQTIYYTYPLSWLAAFLANFIFFLIVLQRMKTTKKAAGSAEE